MAGLLRLKGLTKKTGRRQQMLLKKDVGLGRIGMVALPLLIKRVTALKGTSLLSWQRMAPNPFNTGMLREEGKKSQWHYNFG